MGGLVLGMDRLIGGSGGIVSKVFVNAKASIDLSI